MKIGSILPKLLLSLLLMAAPLALQAQQTKAALEKEKAKLEQEIKKLNNDLAKAKKNTKLTTSQLNTLNKKIEERAKLIKNINSQMTILSTQITEMQDSMAAKQQQILDLKHDYSKVVRMLYREHDNMDKLVLLFDTPSYNHSYLRVKYFKEFSEYRKRQSALISQREQELQLITTDLQRQKNEKNSLLAQEQKNKKILDQEKIQKQKSINSSKQQEKNLTAQLSKKEKEKKQLQSQIQKLINEEIAKARAAAAAKSKASNTSASGTAKTTSASTSNPSAPTAAETALSANFAENKGALSWPVYYKKVLREYGRYKHESGGENMNNGIELLTAPGATVYCVFKGTVTRVFTCPNGTKGIIVRHGDYMTVYANLGTISVKEGTNVNTKQSIGTVYTSDDGQAEFSFQLWKGTQSQNPRSWLR